MMSLINIVGILTSVFGSILAVRYIFLCNFKIDNSIFSVLHDVVTKSKFRLILDEEISKDILYPNLFSGYFWPKDCPFFYLHYSNQNPNSPSKEGSGTIICARWQAAKLKEILIKRFKDRELNEVGVPVEMLLPYYSQKIGILKEKIESVYDNEACETFEKDIQDVLADTKNKTSAIFYGNPGNGKTTYIKYLATKYKLPIKIVTLTPDMTNNEVILMFSRIKENSIVLLEDFDNYFDGRNCIIGQANNGANNMNIKFTFDSILNSLDGVYNSYKKTVFIMTVNDINRVDEALKNRPSRFKYMVEFHNPSGGLREKMIGDWSGQIDSQINLDQLIRLKEFKELNLDINTAISNLGIKLKDE